MNKNKIPTQKLNSERQMKYFLRFTNTQSQTGNGQAQIILGFY